MMGEDSMIKIENVSFGYTEERDTLKKIGIYIRPGECVLLCGKSGCGKTTVTKLVNGLIPHFVEKSFLSGKTTAAKMNISNTPMYELAKKIGSVFQNPKTQFFNIDSDSELAFGLENKGKSYDFITKRIDETSKFLKIDKLRYRNIFQMSGGEKQSLAFASVYAVNPDIYVLDEPSANLDAYAIEVLKEQLERIKKQGKTILIAEHRLYYLTNLVDRVFYMEDGRITRQFSKEEFLSLKDVERVKMGLRILTKMDSSKKKQVSYCEKDELVVKSLSYSINKNIVFKNISFSANSGDIIGIVGHNGVGKTTMIRCISGLIKEKSGTVYFNGKVLKPKQRNKLCYMIMQDVNHQLFSDSVWGECELSKEGISNSHIENVLKTFDLYHLKDCHPMALSGGQKQRLAIATGVLSNKKVIIFDEPTSGLDLEHMVAVGETINKLAENGHIILIITHDIEFLNITCKKILRLGGDNSNIYENKI